MMKKVQYIVVAAALLFSSSAWAAPYTIANSFIAGTPAIAGQVNANFTAAKTVIDDNDTRITANTASAATNTANIATNTSNISNNTAAVTSLQNASPVRTVFVKPVITAGVVDQIASGTTLIAAVAGITGSSPANPFLVKLEPGTFDMGTQTLSLPDGVSIEGSGRGVTTITSNVAGTPFWPATGAVRAPAPHQKKWVATHANKMFHLPVA